uniref:Uncharacterized protein n=1 Tax=Panagrolaimus davidi TaxID=227884 RepID=A0A914Q6V4_9BILA
MNNLSTNLPFPILRHILLTADPVSLFKLAETHPFLYLYSCKLRGLPIDTLIIIPSKSPFSFSSLRKSSPPKPFLFTSPLTGITEVRLKCSVSQLKELQMFEKVTIWKNVIFKHLTNEIFDGIEKLQIENGCNLIVKNCEFSTKTWKKLFKLKWNGFECDSKQPPIECITANLLNLETLSISLYSAFYDDIELICQWKQRKYFKHVQFHHLFAGLYPKLIAEFIELRNI